MFKPGKPYTNVGHAKAYACQVYDEVPNGHPCDASTHISRHIHVHVMMSTMHALHLTMCLAIHTKWMVVTTSNVQDAQCSCVQSPMYMARCMLL